METQNQEGIAIIRVSLDILGSMSIPYSLKIFSWIFIQELAFSCVILKIAELASNLSCFLTFYLHWYWWDLCMFSTIQNQFLHPCDETMLCWLLHFLRWKLLLREKPRCKWICWGFFSQQSGSDIYEFLSVSLFPVFYSTGSWFRNQVSVSLETISIRYYITSEGGGCRSFNPF